MTTSDVSHNETEELLFQAITTGESFLGKEPTLEVIEAFTGWLSERAALFASYHSPEPEPKVKHLLDQLYQLGVPLENWLVEQSAAVENEINSTQQFKTNVQHYAFQDLASETQSWES